MSPTVPRHPNLQFIPQVPGPFIDDAITPLFVLLYGNAGTEDTEFPFVQPGVAFSELLVTFSVAIRYDLNIPLRFKMLKCLGILHDLLVHLRGDTEPVPKIFAGIQNFRILYFAEYADNG